MQISRVYQCFCCIRSDSSSPLRPCYATESCNTTSPPAFLNPRVAQAPLELFTLSLFTLSAQTSLCLSQPSSLVVRSVLDQRQSISTTTPWITQTSSVNEQMSEDPAFHLLPSISIENHEKTTTPPTRSCDSNTSESQFLLKKKRKAYIEVCA